MFEPFPKLTRFSQDWTVTEKIDGSNAQIFIPVASEHPEIGENILFDDTENSGCYLMAGSRSRWLVTYKSDDHMGFAKWVYEHAPALIKLLGPGRHFGEWWGKGIQRGYDLNERRFSLFNVNRWKEEEVNHIPGLHVVPVLGTPNVYLDAPGEGFNRLMDWLKEVGSFAAPGYMNPEGIVMYHGRSGTMFKKTFDYDEKGKWAELQERKTS